MTYISCFSDFAFYFYYYFMENCHTWIIISMWQNDLHTNTSRSVWPILYGLMIKMLQYKMYPAGELAVLRQLLFFFLFCFFLFFFLHWVLLVQKWFLLLNLKSQIIFTDLYQLILLWIYCNLSYFQIRGGIQIIFFLFLHKNICCGTH